KEEIPLDYVHQLIKRKSEQFGGQNNHIITRAAPTYFCITDCWVMTLNEKIAAMTFFIIVPGSSEAWFVDTMYDPEYGKYAVGLLTIHHSIKDLINKKMTRIHLGGEIFLIKMRHYIALNMRLVTGLLKYLNPYLLCSIKRLANFSKKPLNSLNL
ncbi:MAG: GNAT family N-acetyltransferase, partial [Acetobacter sp.]|nr:GNAT family N-acetyltransferase [Acetobacter sp.]